MTASFENRVELAKKNEASIAYELYRLFKGVIITGLSYGGTNCNFKDVIPEFQIDAKRADIVIFASKYGRKIEPFLVIEVKVRALDRPGPSMASAVKRALFYAKQLNRVPTPFFAVYDGWSLLAFRDITQYLITARAAIPDQYTAGELLKGLEEYIYRGKSDSLNNLPKHPDPEFLIRRIMPSIAKVFAKNPQVVEKLVTSWKNLL